MASDAIVNIQQLVKTYPGKTPVEAVKGIDLAVERGELFGLLGPNGAGKSTTISVCTTRSLPTAGRVTIAGVDVVQHPSEARRYMGVVTQFNTLDRQCTVWENLYFHCRYFGLTHAYSAKRTDELSAKTMESLKVPGLYFIGEVVDGTGHLGGFNFQWAWASGFSAGQAV